MRAADVEQIVLEAMPGARVRVTDMTGTGDHFEVRVASGRFAGRTLIEQHQLVMEALATEMDRGIHAVKIKTEAIP